MEQRVKETMIENITLLWTLGEDPEQAKKNEIYSEIDESRQLTMEREIQLASSLAFISGSTDDMLRVMAVCVEEWLDQQGLTIRLASNTGDLSRISESFKGIADIIERAALRGMDLSHHFYWSCWFQHQWINGLLSGRGCSTRLSSWIDHGFFLD